MKNVQQIIDDIEEAYLEDITNGNVEVADTVLAECLTDWEHYDETGDTTVVGDWLGE